MRRYRILPYKQGSKSAKALADALGGKVLKLQGSSFVGKFNDLIINWGNTANLFPPGGSVKVNPMQTIKNASNKLTFFNLMKQQYPNSIPMFWTNKGDIPSEAFPIVCRTVLAGHSGEGIVIADTSDQLVPAPLYVKYVKKSDEYRIHVGLMDDYTIKIISVQRKARRHDIPNEEINWKVRNLKGGFVFVRNNVTPPPSVLEVAKDALRATGLDFGSVDVVWNKYEEKAYVLEINTAPGLEGQTVTDYANFFKEL